MIPLAVLEPKKVDVCGRVVEWCTGSGPVGAPEKLRRKSGSCPSHTLVSLIVSVGRSGSERTAMHVVLRANGSGGIEL